MAEYKIEPTAYNPDEGFIRFARYLHGNIAIQVFNSDYSMLQCVASVNLPESKNLGNGFVYLKGWSENEGIPEALANAGIVELLDEYVSTGYVKARLAKILVPYT